MVVFLHFFRNKGTTKRFNAEAIPLAYTYKKWYLAGHSLGGAMASHFAAQHPKTLSGLYLLAAYTTKDLSDVGFPVTVIYGSNDLVVNRDKIKAGRALVPSAYREIVIDGGNHAYFASYGEQKGDGKATITRMEQWQKTADIIIRHKAQVRSRKYLSRNEIC